MGIYPFGYILMGVKIYRLLNKKMCERQQINKSFKGAHMFIIRLFWCGAWLAVGMFAFVGHAYLLSVFAGMLVVFGMMAGK